MDVVHGRFVIFIICPLAVCPHDQILSIECLIKNTEMDVECGIKNQANSSSGTCSCYCS